jgi:hypothetical protein
MIKQRDIQNPIQAVVTLRDEIRLHLHLAGMELQEEWRRVERKFPELVDAAESFQDVAAEVLDELGVDLRRFSARIRGEANVESQSTGERRAPI